MPGTEVILQSALLISSIADTEWHVLLKEDHSDELYQRISAIRGGAPLNVNELQFVRITLVKGLKGKIRLVSVSDPFGPAQLETDQFLKALESLD